MTRLQQQSESFSNSDLKEPEPGTQKQSQQFKALFLKNLKLQSKQKGTNICQILTPILCIVFTYVMKSLTEGSLKVGAVFEPLDYPIKFNNWQYFDKTNRDARNKLQWVMYSCEKDCDEALLGSNGAGEDKTGVLGNIDQTNQFPVRFHPDPIRDATDNVTTVVDMDVPFFLPANESSIDKILYNRLTWLARQDLNMSKKLGWQQFIPDGTYNITLLNGTHLQFQAKVNDIRQLEMIKDNGISKITFYRKLKDANLTARNPEYTAYTGLLTITHWLTSAFVQQTTGASVDSGIFFMPEDEGGSSFIDTIINFVANLVFPISLSLLFPVFLYTVVLEKEEKLIQMMKMNGMKISSYWLVYFVFNFMLSLITNIIFVFMGWLLTGMRFFTETSPMLILVTLLGWSLAQIGMAVFFQTFLNKSRSANIIGYLISIWTSMIASTLSIGVYQYPNELPVGLRLFAPFAFPRIIYLMLTGCTDGRCFGSISNIPNQMKQQITMLYVNFVFFFLLGAYLFEIIPQQFGVTRNALFPFAMVKRFINRKINRNEYQAEAELEDDQEIKDYLNKNDEDNFSKKQRSDVVHTKNITIQNPLVINNLRKLYYKQGMKTMYAAVKSFNLKVGSRETFGLLGPNGAGKTTLISMITGMFEPNHGNAWVGGYDIKTSIEKAQLQMGVCPQFDLLWPQLTVEEHLYFYARLKGIPTKEIEKKVTNSIEQVKLSSFRKFPSSSLSGGMKRRLSVAISLVGDPRIVFLDEPSTGLDPENRRQLWQVLAKCQKNRAIFITTHMMEEADALCNRVGIITRGVLRTVAPQVTLKKVYGGGYRVSISVVKEERRRVDRESLHLLERGDRVEDYRNEEVEENMRRSVNSFIETQQMEQNQRSKQRTDRIRTFMERQFPGSELLKEYNGYLIFKVLPKQKVSNIFQTLQKKEQELEIVDVAITNSSLQDVFMNVVKEHEIGKDADSDDEKINGPKAQGSFMSFPNKNSELDGSKINATPISSEPTGQKLKKSEHSSIVSRDRESVLSHQDRKQNYEQEEQPRVDEQLKPDVENRSGRESDYF